MRQAARGVVALGAIVFSCLTYSWATLPDVRSLRKQAPVSTAFMRLRASEAAATGKKPKFTQRWVSYARISPTLKRAVLVTEDAGFWDHEGIDLTEIRASLETTWMHGGLLRGGSTITQQLAKNLYLSPSRNPYRKVVELMITRRLEAELPKARILELYLNLIEWGDGVWGADAAARTYFGRSAGELSPEQAAMLAGAIINPRIYSPAHPNGRLLRRQQMILGRMGAMAPPSALPAGPLQDANPPDAVTPE
ncbi:MAG: monofunctional biosynthetic peptidoglycan transglycosylase [Acidobacteriota bacterium]